MPLSDVPFIASLPAQDLRRAVRWFEEKLGLTPILDLGLAGQLYRSGGSQWIIYETPSAGSARNTLGGWLVPDIDAAMGELRAKGVTFQEYALGDDGPTTENGVARDPSGGAAAWFIDSEGNILALTEAPPGMALPGS
jgi:catechol 2,3-dioxygenase-like lactoylglutathione lyase family enzyme